MADVEKLIGELDGMDTATLTKLISAATEIREAHAREERRALAAEVRQKVAALGISVEELLDLPAPSRRSRKESGGGRQTGDDRRRTVSVKYRGPNNETWSGRGKQPKWVQLLLGEGKKLDDYRIAAGGHDTGNG